jgi:hypothetical protein
VAGAPYSGEEVSESVQTLADGTRITQTYRSTKVYRDSFGRTRRERSLFGGGTNYAQQFTNAPVIVEIDDPVAGVRYILDPQNKVAHRQQLQAAPVRAIQPPTAPVPAPGGGGGGRVASAGSVASIQTAPVMRATPPGVLMTGAARPQVKSEKLGTQLIDGVSAEGISLTHTIPAGAQGNDRPITTIGESWFSTELKVLILFKRSDPRHGDYTHRLTNISRAVPDPTLFQPPPEYTIVDEKDEFTINWGADQR